MRLRTSCFTNSHRGARPKVNLSAKKDTCGSPAILRCLPLGHSGAKGSKFCTHDAILDTLKGVPRWLPFLSNGSAGFLLVAKPMRFCVHNGTIKQTAGLVCIVLANLEKMLV